MSISRQNLTAVIVSFKSDQVIDNCIKSIPNEIKIIVVDNSNDKKFKENIEKKYSNVECILSSTNLGMGSGNNFGLKYVKTDFAIIINPDIIFEENSVDELISELKKIKSFEISAPISSDTKYPNYKIDKKFLRDKNNLEPFKVKSVDGYAMVLNLKKLNNIENFYFFDENFFMYLENDDLCKRLKNYGGNIFVVPKSKINHLGGKAVNSKYSYEIELSRNWHWVWSKFYFNKKHYGFLVAFINGLPSFFSSTIKFFLYFLMRKNNEKKIYLQRVLGFLNAVAGKKSSYRPKIEN
tara:strand:+ start:982 stop:1866 length:885 start_codon:yes stop_codon:yes gene_type:complete